MSPQKPCKQEESWVKYLNCWERKKRQQQQTVTVYSTKFFIRSKGEIFSHKQIWKEFIAGRPYLQETYKEVLSEQCRRNGYIPRHTQFTKTESWRNEKSDQIMSKNQ